MRVGYRLSLSMAAIVALASAGAAAEAPPLEPAAVRAVTDCRLIPSDAARLACYDTQVAKLSEARSRGDIVVVDRDEVHRTRKALFGFSLPVFPTLSSAGGHKTGFHDDDISEVSGTVRAATRNGDGGWIVTLDDGARWEQSDATLFGRNPKPGMPVIIRRAALGSYKMTIGIGPTVKARRIG